MVFLRILSIPVLVLRICCQTHPSDYRSDLYPLVLRLEFLSELLRAESGLAQIAGNGDSVDLGLPPGLPGPRTDLAWIRSDD